MPRLITIPSTEIQVIRSSNPPDDVFLSLIVLLPGFMFIYLSTFSYPFHQRLAQGAMYLLYRLAPATNLPTMGVSPNARFT